MWGAVTDRDVADAATLRTATFKVVDHEQSNFVSSEFSLKDSIRLASSPIDVFVENRINDALFLHAMAHITSSRAMADLVKRNIISFRHGGGIGDIRVQLEEDINNDPLRAVFTYVMFDSDSLSKNYVSRNAILLEDLCKKHSVKHLRLVRRAIENYIPIAALYDYINNNYSYDGRAPLRRLTDALKALTVEQRAYFPMKAGLPKVRHPDEDDLYKALSAQALDALQLKYPEKMAAKIYGQTDEALMHRLRGQIEKDDAKIEVRRAVSEILELARAPIDA